MKLAFRVELAVEKAGGVAHGKNGQYRLERRDKRVYVIPQDVGKEPVIDLAVRIDPGPSRGDGYRGEGGRQFPSPPTCELSRAGFGSDVMSPLKTGSPEFDDAIAIEVNHPDDIATLTAVLESEAVRSAVLELSEAGAVLKIEAGPKAWLTARFTGEEKLGSVAEFEQKVERLLDLYEALPAFASSGVARGTPGCGYLTVLGLLGVGGMIFASATDLSMGSRTNGLEYAALGVSPILLVLFLWIGWRGLRRTGSRIMLFGVGLASFLAAPMTCVCVARTINAVGVERRVHHQVRVLDKGHVKRSNSTAVYWAEVTPWKPYTSPITLKLTPNEHAQVKKGTQLDVSLGEGRLGYEWVAEVRVVQ